MNITKKTTTIYTDDDSGFEFTFEPIEDSVKIKKTKTGFEARYITTDDGPESPREWDNFGTMVCFHDRYDLGDKHDYNSPEQFWLSLAEELTGEECEKLEELELEALQKLVDDKIVILPLFLYDHSGITMKTSPFGCQWDSGQVGYIYITYEKIKEEYSLKKISKNAIEKAKKLLVAEIETYDQYLTGDVYTIVKEVYGTDKEQIDYDCVGGFYGHDYALEQAHNDDNF